MWDVIERKRIVPLLENSLKRGKMPNAYLFVGPAHVGKMTLAVNLAQALNCDSETRPCGVCVSCRKIKEGKHADVRVISLSGDKVKDISTEQIEDIQHASSLPPYEGKYKVFIIDGAERLSGHAANRLLKTLEEPEEHVIYILLTDDESRVLSTVISRCQRLEMLPVPANDIEEHLTAACRLEADTAKLLSRLACGCMGWALTAADDETIVTERSTRIEKVIALADGTIDDRFTYVGSLANQFAANRQTVYDELNLWLEIWHDLLLIKAGSGDMITNINFQKPLEDAAARYSLKQIREFIDYIRKTAARLRMNAAPRLALEVLMLNIPWRSK
jgi:DNA polymerase III subunit delta'